MLHSKYVLSNNKPTTHKTRSTNPTDDDDDNCDQVALHLTPCVVQVIVSFGTAVYYHSSLYR